MLNEWLPLDGGVRESAVTRRSLGPQTTLFPSRGRVSQNEHGARDGTDEALYLKHILEMAAEGAVSLLNQLPREHLGSLRLMLNQPIPSRARLGMWRLLLKHRNVSR